MTVLTQRQPDPTGESNLILNGSAPQGGSPDNSGGITRGGVNPAAAAMLVLYEVMAMYAHITSIFSQQQQTQIAAEQNSGKADADALIAGGKAIQSAMKTAAICAYVGAGFGMLMTAAGALAQYRQGSSARTLEQQNKPMTETFNKDATLTTTTAATESSSDPISANAQKLKQGRYGEVEDADREAALRSLRNSPDDYEAYQNRIEERNNTLQRQLANKTQAGSTYFQVSTTVGQSGQAVTNGYSQQAQGNGQAEQAQENAASALNKSSLAMAQTAASSIAQKQNEAAQNISSGQRTLQAIADSSARVS